MACSMEGKISSPLRKDSKRLPAMMDGPSSTPMVRANCGSRIEYRCSTRSFTRLSPGTRFSATTTSTTVMRAVASTIPILLQPERDRRPNIGRLEFAIALVGFDRIHAGEDGGAHLVLGRDHGFGARDRFFGDAARNDDHAVAVTEHVVARPYRDLADGDRIAVTIRGPAFHDVRRREEPAVHGEADREHEVGDAAAAVHDVTQDALVLERFRRQLTH